VTGILGYARVSTGDQDVAGESMRLTEAAAIKVFTDVRSGRSMDRPRLQELLSYTRRATRWPSCASTGRLPSCWGP
jgi:DNA invertase Pin-like site-specific DNA recombinase